MFVFVQSASSAEDDSGDRQETKNLNKDLDLTISSSGAAAPLPESKAGVAEAVSTPLNGKVFIFKLYRVAS
jgi:translation initiation factor 4G